MSARWRPPGNRPGSARSSVVALLLAASMVMTGCGQGGDSSAGGDASTETTGSSAGAEVTGSSEAEGDGAADGGEMAASAFPEVTVVDLATQSPVELGQTLGGGDTPILLWFWAPF